MRSSREWKSVWKACVLRLWIWACSTGRFVSPTENASTPRAATNTPCLWFARCWNGRASLSMPLGSITRPGLPCTLPACDPNPSALRTKNAAHSRARHPAIKTLPNSALLCPHHRRSCFAGKGLLKLGHIGHNIIHPVFRNRVRARQYCRAHQLRPVFSAPLVCIREEELLTRRPSAFVFLIQRLAGRLQLVGQRHKSEAQA